MNFHTYYCEVNKDRPDVKMGVYKICASKDHNRLWHLDLNRLITVSQRVWKQGPKGGVKIIKEPFWSEPHYGYKYLTGNPDAMQEFAWVKLRAKEV